MPHRPAPHKQPPAETPAHTPPDPRGLTAQERAFAARILQAEAASVSALASSLGPEFHAAVDLLVRCADAGGTVLISGLGKSGLIGQKISATLASLGIPSHFVHPAEAVHGDLGRFRPADICIALSYSGETDEVVGLASILRQDNLDVISITRGPTPAPGTPTLRVGSSPPSPSSTSPNQDTTRSVVVPGRSSLERLSTVALCIGACDDPQISPAPTCSTTATLALGDALALCAARRRNFTDDDFVKRHPGGSLGVLLRPITDLLRFTVGKSLNVVPDDLSVAQALKHSETGDRRSGAMLLVDRSSGLLTGLFTDGDLRRLIERNRSELDQPIRAVMTRNPGTLPDTAIVRDAVNMVREFRRDEIPVVDAAGRPIGLLDVQDLIAQRLIRTE